MSTNIRPAISPLVAVSGILHAVWTVAFSGLVGTSLTTRWNTAGSAPPPPTSVTFRRTSSVHALLSWNYVPVNSDDEVGILFQSQASIGAAWNTQYTVSPVAVSTMAGAGDPGFGYGYVFGDHVTLDTAHAWRAEVTMSSKLSGITYVPGTPVDSSVVPALNTPVLLTSAAGRIPRLDTRGDVFTLLQQQSIVMVAWASAYNNPAYTAAEDPQFSCPAVSSWRAFRLAVPSTSVERAGIWVGHIDSVPASPPLISSSVVSPEGGEIGFAVFQVGNVPTTSTVEAADGFLPSSGTSLAGSPASVHPGAFAATVLGVHLNGAPASTTKLPSLGWLSVLQEDMGSPVTGDDGHLIAGLYAADPSLIADATASLTATYTSAREYVSESVAMATG